MRILALCGSLQVASKNLSLLRLAVKVAPPGVEVVVFDGLRALPHFNPDIEATAPSPVVQTWRIAIAGSAAILIATPEYAFSLPGVVKNGIDWVVGSGELESKVVGLTTCVDHPDRGRRGLLALRETLSALSARIIGGEPIVRGPCYEQDVKAWVDSTVAAAQAASA